MQKYIVCSKCKYFPNKADQIKSQQVKIEANNIQWQCAACSNINLYSNEQGVVLPETYIVQFNKKNLLKDNPKDQINKTAVVIDFNNIKAYMCQYYTPLLKEQIKQISGLDLSNFKSFNTLQTQSQWFAKYRLILKGFTKFLTQQDKVFQQNSFFGYIIYLVHQYILSIDPIQHQKTAQINIYIIYKNETYCFSIDQVDKLSNNIINFLKMYCLFQIGYKIPWLANLYMKQLAQCEINNQLEGKVNNILLVGDNFQMDFQFLRSILGKIKSIIDFNELICKNNIMILKFNISIKENNVFHINPLSRQSFAKYINQINSQQQVIVFFKTKNKQIASYKLRFSQISQIKEKLFSQPISQGNLKKTCKSFIYDNSQYKTVKLIKIYCKFNTQNEMNIVLYTFNWHQIQRDLFLEQLDIQILQLHQLKQDILKEDFIKLSNPSPFIKKNTGYSKMDEPQTNEEDCQYL